MNEVECFSVRAEFGDDVERVFRAGLTILRDLTATCAKKTNNVRVSKSGLPGHNFSLEGLFSGLLHVFEDLDTAFHVLVCVLGEVANTKLTVTKLSDEFVVLNSMSA